MARKIKFLKYKSILKVYDSRKVTYKYVENRRFDLFLNRLSISNNHSNFFEFQVDVIIRRDPYED